MVKVHLPANLCHMLSIAERVVSVQATTVGELLGALERWRPGIWDRLCEADGSIRQHVNVFVGEMNARTDGGAALPLGNVNEVWIIPAISGGDDPPTA